MIHTHRLAYTPRFVFWFFDSRNRFGFHSLASSPHIWVNLSDGGEEDSYCKVLLTHLLYIPMETRILWPLLTGIREISCPDVVVIGKSSGMLSSLAAWRARVGTWKRIDECKLLMHMPKLTIGCSLSTSCPWGSFQQETTTISQRQTFITALKKGIES